MSKEKVEKVLTGEETRELRIYAKKIETRENSFYAYKVLQNNGKLMDLKFTREVKNAPEKDATIVVKLKNMNIDKNRRFPVLWVKKIEEVVDTVITVNFDELTDLF